MTVQYLYKEDTWPCFRNFSFNYIHHLNYFVYRLNFYFIILYKILIKNYLNLMITRTIQCNKSNIFKKKKMLNIFHFKVNKFLWLKKWVYIDIFIKIIWMWYMLKYENIHLKINRNKISVIDKLMMYFFFNGCMKIVKTFNGPTIFGLNKKRSDIWTIIF